MARPRRAVLILALTGAVAVPLGLDLTQSADADLQPSASAQGDTPNPHHVYRTDGDGVWLHTVPAAQDGLIIVVPEGAQFDVICWTLGDDVSGNPVWLYGSAGSNTGYVTDSYIDTHWQSTGDLTAQGIPQCGAAQATPTASSATYFYDRSAAVAWARENWDHDPLIQNGGDCTWYTSQALWAGGLPTSRDWTPYSPNGVLGSDLVAAAKALIHGGYSPTAAINPTINATDANKNINYLVNAGLATKTQIDWSDNTAGGAQLGDLIAYDWDNGSNGTIDHVAIVTGYASGTNYPTVSQHSANRLDRYWSFDPASNDWIEFAPGYNPQSGSGNGPPIAYLIQIVY